VIVLRALGHLLDGRQRTPASDVATESGHADGERQAEDQTQQQIRAPAAHPASDRATCSVTRRLPTSVRIEDPHAGHT
jgi:hypothetical protein